MKGEYATIADTTELARRIRVESLQMVARASASHVGAGFSIADILAVLYGCALRIDPRHPEDLNRDRFILSKVMPQLHSMQPSRFADSFPSRTCWHTAKMAVHSLVTFRMRMCRELRFRPDP